MKTYRVLHPTVNLCDFCAFCIADCDTNPVFSQDPGSDNILECKDFCPARELEGVVEEVNINKE